MIIDKKSGNVTSGNSQSTSAPKTDTSDVVEVPKQIPDGGLIDIVKAVMEILREVRWEYGNPASEKIFRTVQWNDGQYNRIVSKKQNLEYELAFPAAFVHYIQPEYLVSQQRIGDGKAKLRIQFVLNRLNVHDPDHELDPIYVAQRIDQDITEKKGNYPCMSRRFQIIYWDFPQSFDHGLQPGWLTYDVWFRETNIWVTRNKRYKKFVMPPFTNHSDQTDEDRIASGHSNKDHKRKWEEGSEYASTGDPIDDGDITN